MCQNATKTAYAVLSGIEPQIKAILTIEGIANTPQATTALAAYDQALADLNAWTQGTPAQDVIQVLDDLEVAVQALPIPTAYQLLVSTILAGIVTVIGIVTGNSPAPPVASIQGIDLAAVQQDHERATMARYSVRAQDLVPFYRIKTRATWLPEREPATQQKHCWNKACALSSTPQWVIA